MRRRQGSMGNGRRAGAYSLVEMLVVIAIIGIIAAVLLPVFATIRENGRQKTALSNLHLISVGLSQFELDNHRAPEVLFAYAGGGPSMASPYTGNGARPGLFPQYIKDPGVFTDPGNPTTDLTATTGDVVPVNVLVPGAGGTGTLTTPQPKRNFYMADAYDANPQIDTATGTLTTTYVARYQTSWTDLNSTEANPNCAAATKPSACNGVLSTSVNAYPRQMRFLNPPGDTYVTCTTYHVPKGKVIVLWANGEAKVLDTSRFQEGANFWQVTP